MPKSTTFSNDFVGLVFNATPIANIADNAGSSPITNLYVSLHTGDPGIGGSQTTNETSYTNYQRVPVAREASGWTVSGGAAENASIIAFPQCGVVGATITYVGIGTASGGAGKMLYTGQLGSSLAVANLIQPQFAAGALTCTES